MEIYLNFVLFVTRRLQIKLTNHSVTRFSFQRCFMSRIGSWTLASVIYCRVKVVAAVKEYLTFGEKTEILLNCPFKCVIIVNVELIPLNVLPMHIRPELHQKRQSTLDQKTNTTFTFQIWINQQIHTKESTHCVYSCMMYTVQFSI